MGRRRRKFWVRRKERMGRRRKRVFGEKERKRGLAGGREGFV